MNELNIKNNILKTKYGNFYDIKPIEWYQTGEIEACFVDEESKLNIANTEIVPLYGYADVRRKDLPSIKFYKNGNLKTISLYEATKIKTEIGEFETEKLTLYEDGQIKRLLLLDGKLSGYWSEDDEYSLAKEYEFSFEFAFFKTKVMSLLFYESGAFKSLTLWPKEIIDIKLKDKDVKVRIGMSVYESGQLKSFEPYDELVIDTPIGDIEAYDKNAIAVNGETNSLNFYENGQLKSIVTSTNIIEVTDSKGNKDVHSPKEVFLFSNSQMKDTITVLVEFFEDYIVIDKQYKYDLEQNKFIIKRFSEKVFTLAGNKKLIGNI